MPAPSNTTPATAIEISALPFSTTQNTHDAGTTYRVWYKYTAQPTDKVIGLWGYYDGWGAIVTSRYYSDAGVTSILSSSGEPVLFEVTPGQTYYFSFGPQVGNPSPAVVVISALPAPADDPVAGDLVVNDDSAGFPISYFGPDTADSHTIRGFADNIVAGEAGDVLANGRILLSYIFGDSVIYDHTFAEITTVPVVVGSQNFLRGIRANVALTHWYAAATGNPGLGTPTVVSRVADDGTVSPDQWALALSQIGALAANVGETILYYASAAVSEPIKRWDLVNDAALVDFATGITGYTIADMIVLPDDTILVLFQGDDPVTVRRYSSAGAVLQTYTFPGDWLGSTTSRMARGFTYDTFWVRLFSGTDNNATSEFREIDVETGTLLRTVVQTNFNEGLYMDVTIFDPPHEPTQRFGPSISCPFWVHHDGDEPPPPTPGRPGCPLGDVAPAVPRDACVNSDF